MIITIGKVNAVIIPEIKYAALFEKSTNQFLHDMFDFDYYRLLKYTFKLARRANN